MDELFQVDWKIFMAGAEAWLRGGNPYGTLGPGMSAGAFAYPPTALPWLAVFTFFGPAGFYVWTALELALWWVLIRNHNRGQLMLLCWSPMILHLVEGQSTLAVALVMWAATTAQRRGWLWGLAAAWAMTKPQVAILPLLWLLWQDRASATRWQFWGGIVFGTVALALPATIATPQLWREWFGGMVSYRGRLLQMAAWQGPSVLLLGLAAYLWYRHYNRGWQWWLSAALFPHTSWYSIVAALPAIQIRRNYWSLLGIVVTAILQLPLNSFVLPWLLAGHMLGIWLLCGGPQARTVVATPAFVSPAGKPQA